MAVKSHHLVDLVRHERLRSPPLGLPQGDADMLPFGSMLFSKLCPFRGDGQFDHHPPVAVK
jgi:hypothetical protein